MKLKLIILILAIFYLVPLVNAQFYYDESFGFSSLSFPFFDLGDISNFYNSNAQWLDFFITFALMIGILNLTLEKKLGSHTPVVLSLVLALGFVALEKQLDFNIGDFGAVAGLVFLLALLMVVLLLAKKIFEKFHEHRPSSAAGTVLFVVALLVALGFFLKDSSTFSSFSLPFTGTQLFGFIVFAAVIGALSYFFYIKSHHATESSSGGAGGSGESSTSTPSSWSFFGPKTQADKDLGAAKTWIEALENYAKDIEKTPVFFNEQYDKAQAVLNKFSTQYRENEKYIPFYAQLQQRLQNTKTTYQNNQKLNESQKRSEQISVDLQKIIAILKKDPNHSRYNLEALKSIYTNAQALHDELPQGSTYKGSIDYSLRELTKIISEKEAKLPFLELEKEANEQITSLNKIISELENFAKGKDIKNLDSTKLKSYFELYKENTLQYKNTIKSSRNKEIEALLNKFDSLINFKKGQSDLNVSLNREDKIKSQYLILVAIFKGLAKEKMPKDYEAYTNLSFAELDQLYRYHKDLFNKETSKSANEELKKEIQVWLDKLPAEIEAKRIIEGLREINRNFFNLSHEEDLRKGFLSKLFFKNSLAKYSWNNMEEAYIWGITFFVKNKKIIYQKNELYEELKKLHSGLKSSKTKPAITTTTPTETKEKTSFFGNLFGKTLGSRLSWLGKITDAEINKKIFALETLLSNPATTKVDLEKAQIEAAIFFGKAKNYTQEHPELEKNVIEIMEKIAAKLSVNNSEKKEEFLKLEGDPAEVRKEINSFFVYIDKIISNRTVSDNELYKALSEMNAFPMRYREYIDDEIKARYKDLVYRFNRKWGEEIEQLTVEEKQEVKLESQKTEESKIIDQINAAFDVANKLLRYRHPNPNDLKTIYEEIQRFKEIILRDQELTRKYRFLMGGFTEKGIVNYR